MNIKYILQKFRWLKILNSPFKPFKIGFYAGKTQIGVPYFLPRKFVRYTEEDIQEAMKKHKSNKNYVQHLDDKLYKMYKGYSKAAPLTVGFSSCGLGWKTKWTNTDFRHEWNPVFSFVFFGYQMALTIYQTDCTHYWEAWLYYEYATDKTKSKRERIEQCKKEFPQTYTRYSKDNENETIDYYPKILKSKYR